MFLAVSCGLLRDRLCHERKGVLGYCSLLGRRFVPCLPGFDGSLSCRIFADYCQRSCYSGVCRLEELVYVPTAAKLFVGVSPFPRRFGIVCFCFPPHPIHDSADRGIPASRSGSPGRRLYCHCHTESAGECQMAGWRGFASAFCRIAELSASCYSY
ncbi:hypothetical protein D3C75_820180 [compost metagenome]